MASKEGLIPVLLLVSDFPLNWVEGVQGREGHQSVKGKIQPTFTVGACGTESLPC